MVSQYRIITQTCMALTDSVQNLWSEVMEEALSTEALSTEA